MVIFHHITVAWSLEKELPLKIGMFCILIVSFDLQCVSILGEKKRKQKKKKEPSSLQVLGWQYNHAVCKCYPPGMLPAWILVNSSKAEIKKVACLRNTPTDIVTSVSRGSETALSYFSTTIKQKTVQDFTRSWSGLYFYQEQLEQLHSWFEFEMQKMSLFSMT